MLELREDSLLLRVRKNPEISPTFQEGDVLTLKRSCDDYTSFGGKWEKGYRYFNKDCTVIAAICGASRYVIDDRDRDTKLYDNLEWCLVEVFIEESEEGYSEAGYIEGMDSIFGAVRARDLREAPLTGR